MLKNLSIYKRLFILVGVLIFTFIISALIGLKGFQAAKEGLNEVYQGGVEEILQLFRIRRIYNVDISDVAHKVRNGTLTWKQGEESIKEAISNLSSILAIYMQNIKEDFQTVQLPVEDRARIENLQHHIKDSSSDLVRLQEILSRQDQEALVLFTTQDMYSIVDPIRANIDDLVKWHITVTQSDYQKALSSLNFSQNLMILVFILSLAVSAITALLIARSITEPLKIAIEAMKKISKGEVLEVEIQNKDQTADEMGHFLIVFNQMIDYKKKIIEAIKAFSMGDLSHHIEARSDKDILSKSVNQMIASSKKMSEVLTMLANGDLSINVQPRSNRDILGLALVSMTKKLKKILVNIQADVVSLTDSTQEITTSVSQVATTSSETAAAVAETTTTVEELKQTAQISAEKAKEVLSSAEETLQVVKDNEKSLQNTIEDMNEINEKMRLISEGIIKLSELGQTIGNIIDSVNDLAEQSNLLAVNAAIEAAKAGEQGKGFGVVAQEIRTLAEQSKAATVQVKSILNDIQNATSTAVLATEQGSKAVDKGVNQSLQTNESMQALVVSMAHVMQAANQITLSSQQQLIGVDQVTVAMNNINEAASQHVDNMKKIENIILSLDSIGKTLKQIIDQFNLTEFDSFQAESSSRALQFENNEKEATSSSPNTLSLSDAS